MRTIGKLEWDTTGPVGSREPVFTWTPSGAATDDRAVLDDVRREGEGGTTLDRLRFGTYLASNVTAVALYELVTEEVVAVSASPPSWWPERWTLHVATTP